jgi:seryl-tRNA synthetase
MLDIRFIRENAELVAEKSKQKGYEVDIPRLLELDEKRRDELKHIEEFRRTINEATKDFQNKAPNESERNTVREIKEHLKSAEDTLEEYNDEYFKLLKAVPNMPANDVPVGASEDENVVAKEWGAKPEFDFKPKTHWEIAEARGLIDKERAAKVAGSRFAYIKGDLVKLQFALIQFVIDNLTNERTLKKIIQDAELQNVSAKPFTPVLPPLMIRTEVFDAMDRLEPREDRYKVGTDEDNLWLQGSAEHTLGPMHMGELLDLKDLPLRYLGYATSFRREAGSYGKDTEGIIRMHQFDKLEMESFTTAKAGPDEHLFMVAIQEYLMQQLDIPYHVLLKCTADIGKPNARGVDIEAWLPGQGKYLETQTADYMTSYQSIRLNTRVFIPAVETTGDVDPELAKEAGSKFVHTNDATALAMGRTLVAIIENFQQADGKIKIPAALQPYMNGAEEI